ncbi:type I-B CRISPR-associated protein Cas7/Cst2/DevR [Candidatus Formimonas warabiya]|uniref:Type I-B CRISPR-associated protein Cas7/Cst2/DevR n=1 Tax=Formimonas warabiya TaxID=1761012 RepID=A0A3G1KYY6_FORW1|nr:type I-B CRISPR-associated protein Cas7/Cst2/DevR [Candidatus Formimonas warabiya]ATW27425.1 type I-B CRISPR-associated protein Cas7/Cst2/DevR [Candidatus Formimonas warabiya]
MKNAKALTITFLTSVSLGSLNGSDKEADNIVSIKKFSKGTEQFPYGSSQWLRRALRDQMASLGWTTSEGVAASIAKGASTTAQKPDQYFDDDLFGFMGTEKGDEEKKGSANKRTSPVRVSPLISLHKYEGDLDFGTNYMGVKAGGNPNIFETEIHAGLYRGTILIELDRIGCGEGFDAELPQEEKAKRVDGLLTAIKNLWSSGRQTRFLADISPKFIAGALLIVKNPIFLETVTVEKNSINFGLIQETLADYQEEIIASVLGAKKEMFGDLADRVVTIGEAFAKMKTWVDSHYLEK